MQWFSISKYTKSNNLHCLHKTIPRKKTLCVLKAPSLCMRKNLTDSFLGLFWYLCGMGPEASQGRKRIKMFYFIWCTKNRPNCNILSPEAVSWVNLELGALTQCLSRCSVNICVWLLGTKHYPRRSEQDQALWPSRSQRALSRLYKDRSKLE